MQIRQSLLSQTSNSPLLSNGDDVFALQQISTGDILDIIGEMSIDDIGDGWAVAGIDDATKDHTIVRKDAIMEGTTDWPSSAGIDEESSQWIVFDQNTFDYIGWHIEAPTEIEGCMDPDAVNYNPDATVDDGSCEYETAVSIYDIQGQVDASPWEGEWVETTGIVTATVSYGYWIQDGDGEWNGIWVHPE